MTPVCTALISVWAVVPHGRRRMPTYRRPSLRSGVASAPRLRCAMAGRLSQNRSVRLDATYEVAPAALCGALAEGIDHGRLALAFPPPLRAVSVVAGRCNGDRFWLRTRTIAGSTLVLVGRLTPTAHGTRVTAWALPEFMWLIAIGSMAFVTIFWSRGSVAIVTGAVTLLFAASFCYSLVKLSALRQHIEDASKSARERQLRDPGSQLSGVVDSPGVRPKSASAIAPDG